MNVIEEKLKAASEMFANEKERDKMEPKIADKQALTISEVWRDEMQLQRDEFLASEQGEKDKHKKGHEFGIKIGQ